VPWYSKIDTLGFLIDLELSKMNEKIDEILDSHLPVEGNKTDEYEVFERVEVHRSENYSAVAEDLEFMWRWRIYRGSELAHHGCSLTLGSSKEAVRHVLVHLQGVDITKSKNQE
jgi:soluble methane monooxygenase-binding protein MmoD